MFSPSRLVGVVSGLVVLMCLLACGNIQKAAVRQKTANDLKQLGMLYHNYHESNGKGPANTQEFSRIAGDPQSAALIAQTGPGGQYVMFWNVKLQNLTQGTSNTVLGHEATVPAAGGLVVMADGSFRQMTAAEFAAAPKPRADGGN